MDCLARVTSIDQLAWCELQPGAVLHAHWEGCPMCSGDAGSGTNNWGHWFAPVGDDSARVSRLLREAKLGDAGSAEQPHAVREQQAVDEQRHARLEHLVHQREQRGGACA